MDNKRDIVAIIPARMGSSRFPGKPMAKIIDKPMIGHVYEKTRKCSLLLETFVATCDKEIADYIESIGGKVIMTSDKHERASDRTAEAMIIIEKLIGKKIDIVVMVQGDEPMVTAEMIEKSIEPFNNIDVNIVNLMSRMETTEEFEDPNEPKVVVDTNNNALYFSREPIPSRKKGATDVPMYKQVCVIPFRRQALLGFNACHETELERIESIDMNRVLENGGNVKMVLIEGNPISVDTESDLLRVSKKLL
jgi:3-deoxy-manno-octulosonate cytidylyltransferase (CMP-KDO synthetase)